MKKVIIYGACSAIATATAKLYAEENVDLFFIAQNEEKVKSLVEDFSVRYEKSPKYAIHNALNTESLAEVFSDAVKELGGLDIILIAHGILPDQEKAEKDLEYLHKVSMINGNSAVYLSQIAANYFVEKSKGTIAVISSVAGDRGRYSNYIYGASKGYISVFLQGLKNKMAHHGVNVLNIKPGFVDTQVVRLWLLMYHWNLLILY
ncbi:MAG: short-chain dehydrogenase [Bacteroidetes bacterium 4572_77]|nr:MAG: short-chain dehydrogenase [Bacteroidetes bacterium 4572_77]